MKRLTILSLLFFCLTSLSLVSQKQVSLEDIWLGGKFYPQLLRGYSSMNDGENYTVLEVGRDIDKYSYKTGKKIGTIFSLGDITDENKPKSVDGYSFNNDESKVLISSDIEDIYRHSTKGFYYVIDLKTKKLTPVCNDGKQQLADFSPKSDKVAYMLDNDLYIKNLADEKVTRVTNDGKFNFIINGAPDWVYEEEFGYAKAFEWSPDGSKLAFVKFNETEVKQFTLTYYGDLYPEEYKYKYPKAGEANSIVSVHIYDLITGKTVSVDIGAEKDIYIPRIKWTNDPGKLCVTRLNRLQNQLDLLFADAATGKTAVVLHEENQYFIDIHDDLTFLADNKHFLWISEKDKWKHIYLYDITGKEIRQITKGNWCVVDLMGINEKTQTLYYISTEETPIERALYSIKLDGTDKKLLSKRKGVNDVEFCSTYKYYINTWSDANTPYYVSVNDESGKEIRELINNETVKKNMEEFGFTKKEFNVFINSKGTDLHYYIMKPKDFDPAKKYPVFIHLYGGPGSQQVMNEWGWFDYAFYQLLTQKGYIVACMDNTGTDFRGEDFSKATYMKMGKQESDDQIEFAKFLGSLSYVDKTRIGIEGWSYGGTMSALCLMRGNDVYKMAISTAPVMNWRYYDNIYSERYMRTPQENPSGYDDYSPINHVKNLKGKLLLIHGTADDNVHVQNSMDFVTALVNANKQFDMMFYPNKNHGIYGGYTRIHLYTKWLEYIIENL
ncbi:MAG: peptidase S9 [Bacteroidetes bacterium GWF2_38_335]|nr:MAG: peptidase S9 [Bacteroidetes bacterium GWF2_38_335]OFY79528.1 MAG: peptidase S9 [Bacteroidetes bacterium RIFOXYA12_FULL_38_20]HBS86589.1 S9 family peptidase [Bacteroidales bacterium]